MVSYLLNAQFPFRRLISNGHLQGFIQRLMHWVPALRLIIWLSLFRFIYFERYAWVHRHQSEPFYDHLIMILRYPLSTVMSILCQGVYKMALWSRRVFEFHLHRPSPLSWISLQLYPIFLLTFIVKILVVIVLLHLLVRDTLLCISF